MNVLYRLEEVIKNDDPNNYAVVHKGLTLEFKINIWQSFAFSGKFDMLDNKYHIKVDMELEDYQEMFDLYDEDDNDDDIEDMLDAFLDENDNTYTDFNKAMNQFSKTVAKINEKSNRIDDSKLELFRQMQYIVQTEVPVG